MTAHALAPDGPNRPGPARRFSPAVIAVLQERLGPDAEEALWVAARDGDSVARAAHHAAERATDVEHDLTDALDQVTRADLLALVDRLTHLRTLTHYLTPSPAPTA